jgi:hypothetical protein
MLGIRSKTEALSCWWGSRSTSPSFCLPSAVCRCLRALLLLGDTRVVGLSCAEGLDGCWVRLAGCLFSDGADAPDWPPWQASIVCSGEDTQNWVMEQKHVNCARVLTHGSLSCRPLAPLQTGLQCWAITVSDSGATAKLDFQPCSRLVVCAALFECWTKTPTSGSRAAKVAKGQFRQLLN